MLLMASLAMLFTTVPPGTTVGLAVLHSKAAAGVALARLRASANRPPPTRDQPRCLPLARVWTQCVVDVLRPLDGIFRPRYRRPQRRLPNRWFAPSRSSVAIQRA